MTTVTTYDSASQRVSVRQTDRTYGGRPIAVVAELDERDQPTGAGYIVAITADTVPIDDGCEIGFRSPIVGDSARGEWLTNWGGPSDEYDDAASWITHHADLGDSLEIVERFAELLRRKWGESAEASETVARAIVQAVPCSVDAGQTRITRIDDAVRWLATCCDNVDAYVCDDGRVRLCQPTTTVSRLADELAALNVGDMHLVGDPGKLGSATVLRVSDGYAITDLTSGSATLTDRLRLVRPADPEDATLTGSAWGGNPRDGLLIPGWMEITSEHGDVVLWDSGACGDV